MKFEDDGLIRNGFGTKYFHFFEFMTNHNSTGRKCAQLIRYVRGDSMILGFQGPPTPGSMGRNYVDSMGP